MAAKSVPLPVEGDDWTISPVAPSSQRGLAGPIEAGGAVRRRLGKELLKALTARVQIMNILRADSP